MASMALPAQTERFCFRPYEPSDVESVIEMFADDYAKKWYPTKSEPVEAKRWIEWNLQNYEQHGVGLWVIEDASTGTFLGDCGLTYQQVEDEQLLEIGYHLQNKHRGKGYAVQSARQCCAFAFEVSDASTVCSIVDPNNDSSIRVASAVHDSMRTFTHKTGNRRNLYWTDRRLPRVRLRTIGYWIDDDLPDLPDPKLSIDADWDINERRIVANYLNAGRPVSVGNGCSPCRICGIANGFGELSDGTFQWPEGLAHYVLDHGVKLPDEVIERALRTKDPAASVGTVDMTWWTTETS